MFSDVWGLKFDLKTIVVGLVFAGLFGIIAIVVRIFTAHVDEGMLLSSAMAVADGRVMYRDFFEFWTPGSVYVLGWLFDLFGVTEAVRWGVLVGLHFFTSILLYLIARKVGFGWRLSLVLVIIFELIHLSMPYLSHHTFGMFFLVLTVYSLLLSIEHEKRWLVLATGVLAGLTVAFMQFEGAIAILASVLSYVWVWKTKSVYRLIMFGLGVLLILSLVVGYFWTEGTLQSLIYSVVYFPFFQYRESNVGWMGYVWVISAACLGLNVLYLIVTRQVNAQWRVIVALAVTTQLALVFITGPTRYYLMSLWLVMLVVWCGVDSIRRAAWWLYKRRTDSLLAPPMARSFAKLLSIDLGLLTSLLFVICAFSLLYPLWQQQVFSGSRSIQTEVGDITVPNVIYSRTVESLGYLSTVGDEDLFYVGPYSSYYFFLMNQVNPIGFSQLTEGYNTQSMFDQAWAELASRRVRYVLYVPNESVFERSGDGQLLKYLEHRYVKQDSLVETSVIRVLPNYELEGSWWERVE